MIKLNKDPGKNTLFVPCVLFFLQDFVVIQKEMKRQINIRNSSCENTSSVLFIVLFWKKLARQSVDKKERDRVWK